YRWGCGVFLLAGWTVNWVRHVHRWAERRLAGERVRGDGGRQRGLLLRCCVGRSRSDRVRSCRSAMASVSVGRYPHRPDEIGGAHGDTLHAYPVAVPDGETILFAAASQDRWRIESVALARADRRTIVEEGDRKAVV